MKAHRFQQTHWKLDDLLSAHQGAEFEQVLTDLESAVVQVENQRERLSPDVDEGTFVDILNKLKAVREIATRLGAYGVLWFSADTQSPDALNYRNQIDQLLTDVQNRVLFFSLWWKALEDGAVQRLLAVSDDDTYYLETLPFQATYPVRSRGKGDQLYRVFGISRGRGEKSATNCTN